MGNQKPILQVIQDDYLRKGIVEFSFQAKNQGRTPDDNQLIAEVYGVNGEFEYKDPAVSGQITKWNNNDSTFSYDLLFRKILELLLLAGQHLKRCRFWRWLSVYHCPFLIQ